MRFSVPLRACSWLAVPALVALTVACSSGTDPGSSPGVASSRGATADGNWPQWLGPERDGISTETGLLEKWPMGGPTVLWRAVNAGDGYSSVSISDGRMFTMGNRDGAEHIIAYDVRNGEELWARRSGEPYSNDKGDGPRGTPTVEGDRLWALGANGDLWCLATDTGEPHWHVNLIGQLGGHNIRWGLSESPLLDGDNVIVTPGSESGSVVALNKNTGELVWQSAEVTDLPGYASAIVEDVDGVRQIIQFTDGAMIGLRASDGTLAWRYERVANDTANCSTPVYENGRLFASSAYDTGGALLALSADGAEEVYFTREMMNHHGGMVLIDGHVYGYSNKNLTCLDFETGGRKWRDRSVGKGAVTAADGKLYLVGEKGTVGLARATPDGYEEISRFQIEMRGRRMWAYPVVTGGKLFIRNQDEILCYDISG